MGKTKGLYNPEFSIGERVQIGDSSILEKFAKTWRYHHKLEPNQLSYANRVAKVKQVSFYHGGDELYQLEDIPGIWHEQCLRVENAKES